ncbi:UNVERIFIED_CONTAM: hypothetical protein Sindi_1281600, partial [Sesamum indicum]
ENAGKPIAECANHRGEDGLGFLDVSETTLGENSTNHGINDNGVSTALPARLEDEIRSSFNMAEIFNLAHKIVDDGDVISLGGVGNCKTEVGSAVWPSPSTLCFPNRREPAGNSAVFDNQPDLGSGISLEPVLAIVAPKEITYATSAASSPVLPAASQKGAASVPPVSGTLRMDSTSVALSSTGTGSIAVVGPSPAVLNAVTELVAAATNSVAAGSVVTMPIA